MPTYYDSQNQSYILTKQLGRGGEGTVYAVENNPDIVAKIYHEPVTTEKAKKLYWMAVHQDERLMKVAAWVIDVLLDPYHKGVVGYLMPNIKAKEIHELYSLKSRRVFFPEATWHFLIHTAANLARAFHSLHKNAHVMGDINHGNCVVLADGTVKLIDCDSYSIKTEKFRYPCEVGVTTHLAPELQGINLRDVERQDKHDNFGMAVIIFQLLFLGRHPFAGNFMVGEDKSLEDAIREHLFAYGKDAARKMVAQPPGTLSLSAVSPAVAVLFERAFTDNFNRPEPREWIEALEDLADSLEQCPLHPGHLFYEKNALCPWCEIESQTGLTLFPFLTTDAYLKAKYKKSFDIVTVENLLESFNIKSNLPAKLSDNFVLPTVPPDPAIIQQNDLHSQLKKRIYIVYFICLFLGYLVSTFLPNCVSLVVISSLIAAGTIYKSLKDSGKVIRLEARDKLSNIRSEWQKIENEWENISVSSQLNTDLEQVRGKIKEYQVLNKRIETSQEKIDETNQPEDKQSENKYLEQEISRLLASLRAGSVRMRGLQQNLIARSNKILPKLAQAESNVKYLGKNFPVGVMLILIIIGTPLFSMMFRGLINPAGVSSRTYSLANRSVVNTVTPSKNYNTYTSKIPDYVTVPDEKITDNEIASLPGDQKFSIINELINRSDSSITAKNYELAERQLQFALRFDQKNPSVLNKLGSFYYDQKKYEQSLSYYNRSNDISNSQWTESSIGINYLMLKKYAAARDVFLKLTNDGRMQNCETYYNLGMAYQGLGNHKSAIDAFNQALTYNKDDVDSIYLIGISYDKLGDKDKVRQSYQQLLEKNLKRAKKFKETIGKSVNLENVLPLSAEESVAPPPLVLKKVG